MKLALSVIALFAIPTLAAPHCAVVHDGICFTSQGQYDQYMGWGTKQQQLETEANK
jgi:hypothetical protein